jgi:hypothetical protein
VIVFVEVNQLDNARETLYFAVVGMIDDVSNKETNIELDAF